jgi:death on curing protein
MTTRWAWIDKQVLLLLHDESLADHGGASGMRDEGLLDSALAQPLNLAAYGKPDFAALTASYAVGLAKNHPFVDGNKRAAFLALGLFLYMNGWCLSANQADATVTMLAVAAGEMSEDELTEWIRQNVAKRAR